MDGDPLCLGDALQPLEEIEVESGLPGGIIVFVADEDHREPGIRSVETEVSVVGDGRIGCFG